MERKKSKVLVEPKIPVGKKRQNQQNTKWRETKNVLTDCSKFLKCMIFSKNTQKIRTQVLCQLRKKKGVDPSFRRLFWKKTFFFGWRQGSSPLHYGFASVPLRSAPAPTRKQNFFPEQPSKLGQLLFFFPTGKEP